MVVNFKDIPVYYINPDFFEDRRKKMDQYLNTLGLEYERIPSNSTQHLRENRINEGQIELLHRAIEKDKYPFLILEDDVRLIGDLPETIEIPKGIKLIYLGASTWECGGAKPKLKIVDYNKEYYRLYHSLGTHAILVPSKESAEYFIDIAKKAIRENMYSDISLAIDSAKQVFLTPKNGPYFYQNDAHTAPITKFLWKDLSSS
jgi:hypothetical protein